MRINTYVHNSYYFDRVSLEIIDHFNLSLRNIDKYLGYIGKMFTWTKEPSNACTARSFVNNLVIPYYVAVMLFRPNIYDSFMNGDFTDYLI